MARETIHYHKVTNEQAIKMMEYVRKNIGTLFEDLEDLLPNGRSKSLALTHLEDVLMRSIQAIAIEHGECMPFTD